MEEFARLRRTVGIAALVGLSLPLIAQLAAAIVPLLVVVWAILSFGSLLLLGRRN